MIIKATVVRKKFNDRGVQVNDSAIKQLNDIIERDIHKMVVRCINGNVKRLTPELIHIAIDMYSTENKE